MNLSKKKILIIGASGLLGQNFINYLNKKKINFDTFYNQKKIKDTNKSFRCNLLNYKDVNRKLKNYDLVFMCAGIVTSSKSNIKPINFFYKNIIIFFNLFYSSLNNNVKKIIWVSSSTIYNNSSKKFKEIDKLKNFDLNVPGTYIFLELLSRFFNNFTSLDIRFIRTGNIYGPHDHFNVKNRSQVIPNMIELLKKKKIKKIIINPLMSRDFTYVDDVIKAMILISKGKNINTPVNFSSGIKHNNAKLIEIIGKYFNKNVNIVFSKPKEDFRNLSNKRFNYFFKNIRRTSLKSGLKKTLEWYEGKKK